jgi:hypothetical protein
MKIGAIRGEADDRSRHWAGSGRPRRPELAVLTGFVASEPDVGAADRRYIRSAYESARAVSDHFTGSQPSGSISNASVSR